MNVRFSNPTPARSAVDAVPLYGIKEFESPTRSTVALLDLLIHSEPKFLDAVEALGFATSFDATLEYTVSPRDGRGKASHTDLMLTAGDHSLAIEAKWTEPMYEKVSAWLEAGSNRTNRCRVLDGWLRCLNRSDLRQTTLLPQDNDGAHVLANCVYQMVHRAASAAEAGKHPTVAYFLFHCDGQGDHKTATDDQIREELQRLWRIIGSPTGFPFHVVTFSMSPTTIGQHLLGLKRGDSNTSESVTAALQDDSPLFTFTRTGLTTIS
jgi:hypothetical protein